MGTGVFGVWALLFVAALLVGLVIMQNVQRVRFNFLWFEARPPLLVVIVVTALLTAGATEGVTEVWRRRRRRIRNERSELGRLRHDRPEG